MPKANAQQISVMLLPNHTGHSQGQPRSPVKEQVKKERDMLKETNSFLGSKISKLTKAAQRGQQKIESLNKNVKE